MDKVTEERIRNTMSLLNEKQRRLYLANEAKAIGYGGISRVTITRGLNEITRAGYQPEEVVRCRQEGGGRKLVEQNNLEILELIEDLLEPHTKGDPMNPLRWTSKSMRALESAFAKAGCTVSNTTIAQILKTQGYSLQANRKELDITPRHPDLNEQFEHINKMARALYGSRHAGCFH
jgi:hypothetical protein